LSSEDSITLDAFVGNDTCILLIESVGRFFVIEDRFTTKHYGFIRTGSGAFVDLFDGFP
jgi:hypothetical protein